MLRIFFLLTLVPVLGHAQEDLFGQLPSLDSLGQAPVSATFKSGRVVNGQSIETVKQQHLDFSISHRFGRLNSGAYQLFGLDQATIRFGFEYGLTNRLMVGVGRSTIQKAYDSFVKYKLLQQSSTKGNMPVSITVFGSLSAYTVDKEQVFQDRIAYVAQILAARKFSERLSIQISPTWIHRNAPLVAGDEKGLVAIGIGGRFKLNKRLSVNSEYFYTARSKNTAHAPYYDTFSIGVDIETGGHVFQLHFTNALGMIERQFIGETSGSWGRGDIHYGFNISRTFGLGQKSKLLMR